MVLRSPQEQADPTRIQSGLAVTLFRWIERSLLVLTAGLTIIAAVMELWTIYEKQEVGLADILLMFLYTEVIAMIAVFYTGKASSFVFPIFIAITAIARLIVLQGKDMQAANVVFEAGAILLLAFAALVMGRVRSD